MMTKRRYIILTSTFIVGLMAGWLVFSHIANTPTPVEFKASYAQLSHDEMIAQADAIFIGEVIAISLARWNQDSGEYWQEQDFVTLPYHQVEVRVDRILADKLLLGQQVAITVLGGSPTGSVQSAGITTVNHAEHTLKVGDRAIFFVVKRDLAWRGGLRPVTRFIAAPWTSYLTQASDGLYHSQDQNEPPLSLDALQARLNHR